MINGKWTEYPADVALVLEKAYQEKRDSQIVTVHDETFDVHLDQTPFMQLNPRNVGDEQVVERTVLKYEDAVRRAKLILSGKAPGSSKAGGPAKPPPQVFTWEINAGRWLP